MFNLLERVLQRCKVSSLENWVALLLLSL
ncbi:hypothetical protein LINPERPRIM_LOCUS26049 [Linum perenne]